MVSPPASDVHVRGIASCEHLRPQRHLPVLRRKKTKATKQRMITQTATPMQIPMIKAMRCADCCEPLAAAPGTSASSNPREEIRSPLAPQEGSDGRMVLMLRVCPAQIPFLIKNKEYQELALKHIYTTRTGTDASLTETRNTEGKSAFICTLRSTPKPLRTKYIGIGRCSINVRERVVLRTKSQIGHRSASFGDGDGVRWRALVHVKFTGIPVPLDVYCEKWGRRRDRRKARGRRTSYTHESPGQSLSQTRR